MVAREPISPQSSHGFSYLSGSLILMDREMLKALTSLVAGGLIATLSAQDSPAPNTPAEFLTQIRKTTETLKSVTDVESAKAAAKDLENWRKTPMATRDEKARQKLDEWIKEEPEIKTALEPLQAETKRIESTNAEAFAVVFEALTGIPKVDLKKHFEELARILRTVANQEDLNRAADELKKWGLPVFKLMDADIDHFAEQLKAQPGSEPAQKAYLQELKRLESLGPEFTERLVETMGAGETRDRMQQKAQEAAAKLVLVTCKNETHAIAFAMDGFVTEYSKLPWQAEGNRDSTVAFDDNLEKVLGGEDASLNPKKLKFLMSRQAGPGGKKSRLDPWGTAYRVTADVDGDSKITLPPEYGKEIKIKGIVGVDSAGPDRKFETTRDNVTSWEIPKD